VCIRRVLRRAFANLSTLGLFCSPTTGPQGMRTDPKNWLQRHIAWFILFLGLLATALVGLNVQRGIETAAVRQFAYVSDQITTKVRERLAAQEMLLRSGAAFLSAFEG